MMMHKMYADVIIPLKFRDSVTYSVPEGMEGKIVPGSIVRVTVVGRSYSAIVIRLMQTPPIDPARIKPLQEIVAFPPVSGENMEFLRQVASYYMCSVGDAFRFAAPSTVKAVKKPGKSTGTGDTASEKKAGPLPVLSPEQAAAAGSIRAHFDAGRNVLLHGVTGSGKTEIYITLAAECLSRGLNVLYLVPEIALSRQIQSRLAACFGDGLMVYHSKQTAAHRREVYSRIAENARPAILLGLRSALFLPFGGGEADLGGGIIPFVILVYVATVNSVNLTDGLDGLAATSSAGYFLTFALLTFMLFSYAVAAGEGERAEELFSLSAFSVALLGGLLGYLVFNSNPAVVMMGDTGSLGLGAAVATVAVFSRTELLLPVAGIMFVWSSISVIVQVLSFKCTGRRVFLMAPFHHHLEMKGFSEPRICALYLVLTLAAGALTLIFARIV